MSDPGLTHRLSQRSRRAGIMIGISMVVTIAFCAVAFTVIFTALEGFTSDFVSSSERPASVNDQDTNEPLSAPAEAPDLSIVGDSTEPEEDEPSPNSQESVPTPTPSPVPDNEGDEEDENQDEEDDGFDPDYQLRNGPSINLREGPSRATSIVDTLPPATPLEYLDEDAPADLPGDGERWMMFRTEGGLEGWVREIDTTDYEP